MLGKHHPQIVEEQQQKDQVPDRHYLVSIWRTLIYQGSIMTELADVEGIEGSLRGVEMFE